MYSEKDFLEMIASLDEDKTKLKYTSILKQKRRLQEKEKMFETIKGQESTMPWTKDMKRSPNGNFLTNEWNAMQIITNDPKFLSNDLEHPMLSLNEFSYDYLRWSSSDGKYITIDKDFVAKAVNHCVKTYPGFDASKIIPKAINNWCHENKFNPIKKFILSEKWDGTPRIETLLIRYFGVKDTPYNRIVIRKFLVAAVNRIFNPGCPFDQVLLLISEKQGVGKSKFFSELMEDPHWCSSSIDNISNADIYVPQLRNSWICELSEAVAIKKCDNDTAKSFFARQSDNIRLKYDVTATCLDRHCVFFASTNDPFILKDLTGNRRYWPIDIPDDTLEKRTNQVVTRGGLPADLAKERTQIWAEAYVYYKQGEVLDLPIELDKLVAEIQESHLNQDSEMELVAEWLDNKVKDRSFVTFSMIWKEVFNYGAILGKKTTKLSPNTYREKFRHVLRIKGYTYSNHCTNEFGHETRGYKKAKEQ